MPARTEYHRKYREARRWITQNSNYTKEAFSVYMSHLYPVELPPKRVSTLYTLRNKGISKRYKTFRPEVRFVSRKLRSDDKFHEELLKVSVLDIGSGGQDIPQTLQETHPNMRITTLDKDPAMQCDYTADYSCPNEYADMPTPDIGISSVQHNLSDILLKQQYAHVKDGIIAHVQCDYITNAPWYRRDWLKEVMKTGVARVITGLPLFKERRGVKRCQWLILFKSKKKFEKYFDWPAGTLTSGELTFSD